MTQPTVNLKELTLIELKSFVYDRLAIIENTQKEIQILNHEISIRNSQVPNGSSSPVAEQPVSV